MDNPLERAVESRPAEETHRPQFDVTGVEEALITMRQNEAERMAESARNLGIDPLTGRAIIARGADNFTIFDGGDGGVQ